MFRRSFLKSAATISASLPLGSLLKSPIDERMGVVLVGLGKYSTHQLGPALEFTSQAKLVGVVTGDPGKGAQWSKDYDFPQANVYNYDNFDLLRDNPDVDIVYIVLPNFMHKEYTIRALQAGKHVICEKPLAITSKDGQEMVDTAHEVNRKLQVGYRLYFEPHHLEIQRLVKANGLENVRMMESSLGFDMARPGLWRIDKEKGGGGAIIDLGLYAIQAARRTKADLPVKVRATGKTLRKDLFKGIYEYMYWQLEFEDGTICNSSTSYSTYVDRFYVSQKSDWYELNPSFNAMGAKARFQGGEILRSENKFQQVAQIDEFVQSIRENRPSLAHGAEGVIDLKIIEAIVRSADSGVEIPLTWPD